MFLLGHHLPDNQKIRLALTGFYGLSYALSSRLCARLSLHESIKVGDLTDSQVTQISAYLSSPGSIGAKEAVRTRGPLEAASEGSSSSSSSSQTAPASASKATLQPPSQRSSPAADPMRSLLLESDLRRAIRANINHHRQIGTYRGRRHSQGLPVRGQRTSSNALTARKLNKIERRAFTTMAGDVSSSSRSSPRPTVTSLLAALKRPIF